MKGISFAALAGENTDSLGWQFSFVSEFIMKPLPALRIPYEVTMNPSLGLRIMCKPTSNMLTDAARTCPSCFLGEDEQGCPVYYSDSRQP